MKFVIGVDGGGTKTTVALADLKGHVMACVKESPFEYVDSTLIKDRLDVFLIPLIKRVIDDAEMDISDCEAVYMGITGIDSIEESKEVKRVFKELWTNVKVRVENDAIIAFYAATNGEPGVMIIGGTGSIAYGEDGKGNRVRIGGLGPIISDEGSGYDIGRRGIMVGIKSEDGRGKKSALEDLIKEEFKLKEVRDIQFSINKNNNIREVIASVAPIVEKAADLGDQEALKILDDAGFELAKIATAAIKVLRIESCIVVVVGSILKKCKIVFESFKDKVLKEVSDARISVSEREPAEGAVILAIKDLRKSDL